MQSIADILRAALTEATKAEAQKHALAKRLYNEIHDAADELRVALAALTYKADVTVVLSGSDFILRAGRDDLIALRWRPAMHVGTQDGMPDGWACTGKTNERHATAVDALRAGLKHPETVRAMVEVLRSLPVGHP